MSGIGERRIVVSEIVLSALLLGRNSWELRQHGPGYEEEMLRLRATLDTLPNDADLVDVRVVDRNMVGKPPSEAGKFAFCMIWTHYTFPSDQVGVLPEAEHPTIPEAWTYARPDEVRAQERQAEIERANDSSVVR
jgi:hypothetical protein